MIEDRNKTDLTKHVTTAAIAYLDERGCKPIETEVRVDDGWIADIASVISPTRSELVALKLIEPPPRWTRAEWTCERRDEWLQRAMALQKLMTVLIEVKTSRSDFSGDKKWKLRPPTALSYVAVPPALKGLAWGLPDAWGILVVSDKATRLSRTPLILNQSFEKHRDVILQIAVRRDHDTRYARLRDLQRRDRDDDRCRKSLTRVIDAMRAMEDIVEAKGESLESVLAARRIDLPDYYIVSLQRLWGAARK